MRVAISGYFDPIHDGHLDHIEKAKALGDWLVVIVSTEEQCLTKHGWVWLSLEGKCRLLKKLGADEIVLKVDTDGTSCETLRLIRPDIFAKGAEYDDSNTPEVEACREIGCKIVYGVGDRLNRSSDIQAIKGGASTSG